MNEKKIKLKIKEIEEMVREATYQIEKALPQLYRIRIELAKVGETGEKCLKH